MTKKIEMLDKLLDRLQRVNMKTEGLYFLCSDRLRFSIPDEHWVKKQLDEMGALKSRYLPYQVCEIVSDSFVNNNRSAGNRVMHCTGQKCKFIFSKASQVIEMSQLIITRS